MKKMFIFYLFVFIIGTCVGSFLNAWIWRLHRDQSMFGRRSYCPKCKKQLKNWDLIPMFSFLFLGGKCRFCKKKISWQYPAVEFSTGLLYLISFINVINHFGSKAGWQIFLWLYWYFIAILIVIFVFDLKYYLILDKVTIPAMIMILFINLILGCSFVDLIMGAIIGGGFFWVQHHLSKGKWIGGGDIRLGALIGLMLGWKDALITLFMAYVFGAFVGIILIASRKKKLNSKIPFGTFLSGAAIVVLLWGDKIIQLYQKAVRIY